MTTATTGVLFAGGAGLAVRCRTAPPTWDRLRGPVPQYWRDGRQDTRARHQGRCCQAGEVDDKNVLDAALIAAAQAVEHYEMTRYGSLIAWAGQLGQNNCARLLQQNGECKADPKS
jgi:hypothetical protein